MNKEGDNYCYTGPFVGKYIERVREIEIDNKQEFTIPLSFGKYNYDIILKPFPRHNENYEFNVSMKCRKRFAITPQAIQAIKDPAKFVEMEAEIVLRDCLKSGIPEQRIISAIKKLMEDVPFAIYGYEKAFDDLKKELGLE